MPTRTPDMITVQMLKDQLSSYPDDFLVDFSGLEFNQLKQRADGTVQIEFTEQVYRDRTTGHVVVQNLE